MENLVKMSSKGQLVVPQDIREELGLQPGDQFVSIRADDAVIFKRVNLQEEFSRIAREIQQQFKNVKKEDVDEAVQWARE